MRNTLFGGQLKRLLMTLLVTTICAMSLVAQSTQGLLLGSVKDSGGAAVPGAEIKVINLQEQSTRNVASSASGNYRVADLKPGHYRVEVKAKGFATAVVEDVELLSRQELRQEIVLTVGADSVVVEVKGDTAGLINTESGAIASSFDAKNILNLPANFRANGGTSPLSLVQTLPGVQPDNSGNFSVQGGMPFQSETSVDGITTQSTTSNHPLSNAWPSAESIRELRVDGVNNNAEFGQPGAITSVSKSGGSTLHGGLFWNHQNRAFDATSYGQKTKPQKIGNDYGVSVGGPVVIPGLYDGRGKSFFFGAFEGFRYPKGTTLQEYVPTNAMRNGDFSGVKGLAANSLKNPFTGGVYSGNQIANISAVAQKVLALYPKLPDSVTTFDASTPNYIVNADNSYHSNQFDARVDHTFNDRLRAFARYSWKDIGQTVPTMLLLPTSSNIDNYRMLAASVSYVFTPSLLNEARFGFTLNNSGSTNSYKGADFTDSLGLAGISKSNLWYNGVTQVSFNTLTSLNADRLSSITRSNTYEGSDVVSWSRGHHAMKFGVDIRAIEAITPLGFNGADNYGTFLFKGVFTGNDFADFLLGLPSESDYDTVQQDNDGKTKHYHLFAQDSWQVNSRLTLTYGLRYEYHPAYTDPSGNVGNFDPSVAKSGRVIYPDGKAALLSSGMLASFNACALGSTTGASVNGAPCTPVLSASQAGLPNTLRSTLKDRFMPRLGFAWRPFGNESTVIRGGIGMYNITLLGGNFYSLTGTLQSATQTFTNSLTSKGPSFQWPSISNGGSGVTVGAYGTAYFGTANDINWKDPSATQFNVSFERELPGATGFRASYIGMRSSHLVWAPNLNDMSYSTTSAMVRPLSDRPFPNWGRINTRSTGAIAKYNSMQLSLFRRLRNGFSFDSTYTLAENKADNQGPAPGGFAGETGGRATYAGDAMLDYGNVVSTPRHRWLTTGIVELPFGRGKKWGGKWNGFVNGLLGGWQISNIFTLQSGDFLTPYFTGGDPSGTGSGNLGGRTQRPDVIGDWKPSKQNAKSWINPNAFACPGYTNWTHGTACTVGDGPGTPAPIGRFGDAKVGSVNGPGFVNLSTGFNKDFVLTERVRLKAGFSFTNILNHTNLGNPNMDITSTSFGKITSARSADMGGSRTGQGTIRIEF